MQHWPNAKFIPVSEDSTEDKNSISEAEVLNESDWEQKSNEKNFNSVAFNPKLSSLEIFRSRSRWDSIASTGTDADIDAGTDANNDTDNDADNNDDADRSCCGINQDFFLEIWDV